MIKPYYQDSAVTLYCAPCEDVLPHLSRVDAVISDPPYGTTSNEWDVMPALPWLWSEIRRLGAGVSVMTASQPFTSLLVASNLTGFRHEWIWRKNRGSNFANTVREPFKEHESILVFADKKWTYNPQPEQRRGGGADRANYKCTFGGASENYHKFEVRKDNTLTEDRVPSSVQEWNTETGLHPTQKPLGLMAYLIATYTNSGDVILDPYAGSGTTLRAAKNLGRKIIGIEKVAKFAEIAAKRMEQECLPLDFAPEPVREEAPELFDAVKEGSLAI